MLGQVSHWPEAVWWRPAVRAAAALLPLLTCAVLYTIRDDMTAATSVLVLVLWVVAAASTGDRVAGVVAGVSAGAWFDYFLTQPYLSFAINDADDIEALVLLLSISVAVTEIALWGHRQQVHAARRSGYLDGIVKAARTAAEGHVPAGTLIDVVASQIAEVLSADGCRFVPGPMHDPRIAVLDYDGVLTRGGRPIGVDRAGLPTDEYVAVLVRSGQRVAGHFLVTASTHVAYPTREQRRVAVLLADQVAVPLGDAEVQ